AAFSVVIIYDAANVRYYSGVNIRIVKQLIKDLKEQTNVDLSDPVYLEKTKDVLGHRWVEVFGGILLGIIVASIMFTLIY
ncbi:MAG: divergent PAP2 family protein, partial [Erysipelotrichaceae bacterium]|nr:divergent PAP2 family protein [Erysipelotrichaceae bacterium]